MFKKIKSILFPKHETSDNLDNEVLTVPLAICTLLFEVAWSDQNIDDSEEKMLKQVMHDMFNIPTSELDALSEKGKSTMHNATGSYPCTKLIMENLDLPERKKIIVGLFKVAFVHAHMDKYEESTIRNISQLLHVPHTQFIEAKLEARDSIEQSK